MDKEKVLPPDRTVLGAERSLAILNAFIESNDSLTLKELEERTGLFKSVIHRYMLSFIKYGYVIQRPDHSYLLGPRLFQLGKTFEKQFNYADTIKPMLKEIVEQTKESAAFFIKQNDKRVCLYAIDSYEPVKANVKEGAILDLDNTSSAQILKFFSVPENISRSQGRYVSTTTGINTVSTSMAAPVFGYGNTFIGALTIFGISLRFNPASNEDIRQILLTVAQKLSTQLGAHHAYTNLTTEVFDLSTINA